MRIIRPLGKILPRTSEALRYMGCSNYKDENFLIKLDNISKLLSENISPVGCYLYADVIRKDGFIDIGFGKTNCTLLHRALDGCDRAALFCATLGQGADRFLTRQASISPLDQMMCDALASSAVEVWADEVQERIKGNFIINTRVSPGYGDFLIEYQKQILGILEAEKIGISLLTSMQMTPSKTVSAVFGIKKTGGNVQ